MTAMSNPIEKIDAEIKAATLARDAAKLGLLRMLKSAMKYSQIEKKLDALSEADFLAIVQKQIKQRQDSAESFRAANRADLFEKEEAEIKLLQVYLPQALPPAEVEALVKAVIAEIGATSKAQLGQVMKAAIARAAGRADGKTISTLASKLLGS